MKVHIAAITTDAGTNLYAAATEAQLTAQLADYCREYWEKDGPGRPAPSGDHEIVEAYFDHQSEYGDESMTREEIDIPQAECDYSPDNSGPVL